MTEASLTATELAEWSKVAAESDTTHGYVLRRMLATIDALEAVKDAGKVIIRAIDSHHPKWIEMGRFDLARSEVEGLRSALARYEEGGR